MSISTTAQYLTAEGTKVLNTLSERLSAQTDSIAIISAADTLVQAVQFGAFGVLIQSQLLSDWPNAVWAISILQLPAQLIGDATLWVLAMVSSLALLVAALIAIFRPGDKAEGSLLSLVSRIVAGCGFIPVLSGLFVPFRAAADGDDGSSGALKRWLTDLSAPGHAGAVAIGVSVGIIVLAFALVQVLAGALTGYPPSVVNSGGLLSYIPGLMWSDSADVAQTAGTITALATRGVGPSQAAQAALVGNAVAKQQRATSPTAVASPHMLAMRIFEHSVLVLVFSLQGRGPLTPAVVITITAAVAASVVSKYALFGPYYAIEANQLHAATGAFLLWTCFCHGLAVTPLGPNRAAMIWAVTSPLALLAGAELVATTARNAASRVIARTRTLPTAATTTGFALTIDAQARAALHTYAGEPDTAKAIVTHYERGIKARPQSALLHVLYAYFLAHRGNSLGALTQLEIADNTARRWDERLAAKVARLRISQMSEDDSLTAIGKNGVTSVSGIQMVQALRELACEEARLEAFRAALEAQSLLADVWASLGERTVNAQTVLGLADALDVAVQTAMDSFEKAQNLQPGHVATLREHAQFLLDTVADQGGAVKLLEAAEEVEDRASKRRTRIAAGPFYYLEPEPYLDAGTAGDSIGVLLVGLDHMIKKVNGTACALFGWRRSELEGKPSNITIPPVLHALHDAQHRLNGAALDGSQASSQAVGGTSLAAGLGIHRDGHLMLTINQVSMTPQGMAIVFAPRPSKEQHFIIQAPPDFPQLAGRMAGSVLGGAWAVVPQTGYTIAAADLESMAALGVLAADIKSMSVNAEMYFPDIGELCRDAVLRFNAKQAAMKAGKIGVAGSALNGGGTMTGAGAGLGVTARSRAGVPVDPLSPAAVTRAGAAGRGRRMSVDAWGIKPTDTRVSVGAKQGYRQGRRASDGGDEERGDHDDGGKDDGQNSLTRMTGHERLEDDDDSPHTNHAHIMTRRTHEPGPDDTLMIPGAEVVTVINLSRSVSPSGRARVSLRLQYYAVPAARDVPGVWIASWRLIEALSSVDHLSPSLTATARAHHHNTQHRGESVRKQTQVQGHSAEPALRGRDRSPARDRDHRHVHMKDPTPRPTRQSADAPQGRTPAAQGSSTAGRGAVASPLVPALKQSTGPRAPRADAIGTGRSTGVAMSGHSSFEEQDDGRLDQLIETALQAPDEGQSAQYTGSAAGSTGPQDRKGGTGPGPQLNRAPSIGYSRTGAVPTRDSVRSELDAVGINGSSASATATALDGATEVTRTVTDAADGTRTFSRAAVTTEGDMTTGAAGGSSLAEMGSEDHLGHVVSVVDDGAGGGTPLEVGNARTGENSPKPGKPSLAAKKSQKGAEAANAALRPGLKTKKHGAKQARVSISEDQPTYHEHGASDAEGGEGRGHGRGHGRGEGRLAGEVEYGQAMGAAAGGAVRGDISHDGSSQASSSSARTTSALRAHIEARRRTLDPELASVRTWLLSVVLLVAAGLVAATISLWLLSLDTETQLERAHELHLARLAAADLAMSVQGAALLGTAVGGVLGSSVGGLAIPLSVQRVSQPFLSRLAAAAGASSATQTIDTNGLLQPAWGSLTATAQAAVVGNATSSELLQSSIALDTIVTAVTDAIAASQRSTAAVINTGTTMDSHSVMASTSASNTAPAGWARLIGRVGQANDVTRTMTVATAAQEVSQAGKAAARYVDSGRLSGSFSGTSSALMAPELLFTARNSDQQLLDALTVLRDSQVDLAMVSADGTYLVNFLLFLAVACFADAILVAVLVPLTRRVHGVTIGTVRLLLLLPRPTMRSLQARAQKSRGRLADLVRSYVEAGSPEQDVDDNDDEVLDVAPYFDPEDLQTGYREKDGNNRDGATANDGPAGNMSPRFGDGPGSGADMPSPTVLARKSMGPTRGMTATLPVFLRLLTAFALPQFIVLLLLCVQWLWATVLLGPLRMLPEIVSLAHDRGLTAQRYAHAVSLTVLFSINGGTVHEAAVNATAARAVQLGLLLESQTSMLQLGDDWTELPSLSDVAGIVQGWESQDGCRVFNVHYPSDSDVDEAHGFWPAPATMRLLPEQLLTSAGLLPFKQGFEGSASATGAGGLSDTGLHYSDACANVGNGVVSDGIMPALDALLQAGTQGLQAALEAQKASMVTNCSLPTSFLVSSVEGIGQDSKPLKTAISGAVAGSPGTNTDCAGLAAQSLSSATQAGAALEKVLSLQRSVLRFALLATGAGSARVVHHTMATVRAAYTACALATIILLIVFHYRAYSWVLREVNMKLLRVRALLLLVPAGLVRKFPSLHAGISAVARGVRTAGWLDLGAVDRVQGDEADLLANGGPGASSASRAMSPSRASRSGDASYRGVNMDERVAVGTGMQPQPVMFSAVGQGRRRSLLW